MVGDPPKNPGVVGRSLHSPRSGWEALLQVRECSGFPPGGRKVVMRPFWRSRSDQRPSRKSGTGQETLPEVQNYSGDPSGDPVLLGRPSRRSGSGWRPSRRSGTGCDTLLKVRNWSEDTP